MSAFLGPIHQWLYNKIEFQNEVVNQIIQFEEKNNSESNINKNLIEKFGDLENKPLEEIIDPTNIHGWLQEKVSLVEYRLAYSIKTILENDPESIKSLEELFYNIGKANASLVKNDASLIYRSLSDLLLDGMPCDRANQLEQEDSDTTIWVRNKCVHKKYWDEMDLDIENYYLLRESMIQGLLFESEFIFEKSEEKNIIRRK